MADILTLVPESNMKILDKVWFNGGNGAVGMILCEDIKTNQTMAFIGSTDSDGLTEDEDAQQIAKWGAKLPKPLAEAQFGQLPDYKY